MSIVIPMGKMTLSFAGAEHEAADVDGVTTDDVDITLPALEGKLDFNVGPTTNNVVLDYRPYTYDEVGATPDTDVTAYTAGFNGRAMFGAFNVAYAAYTDRNQYRHLLLI